MKKWILRLLTALLIFSLLVGATLYGLFRVTRSHLCKAHVLEKVAAPSGKLSAVIFDFNCGATTGFVTDISILAPDEVPDGPGEVFISDADRGAVPPEKIYPTGGPKVRVLWRSDDQLEVAFPNRTRIFKQEDQSRGVTIKYSQY